MAIIEGHSRTTIRTTTLRGCELALLHLPPLAGTAAASCLLQLDRAPHTWTLTLTGAELAGLARLNPDDGPPRHTPVLGILADLALALELFRPDGWEGLRIADPRTGRIIPNAVITPLSGDDLATLGRLASELLAAAGVAR